MIDNNKGKRRKFLLLISEFIDPTKDIIASTLAWMCREQEWAFDVYYVQGNERPRANRGRDHIHESDQGGGLFSTHGSTLLGGRHHQMVARALGEFETTIVKLNSVYVFDTLIQSAAKQVIEKSGSLIDLLQSCANVIECDLPHKVVAIQTKNLPENLKFGIAQFAYPEIVYRKAIGVPLELSEVDINRLQSLHVKNGWTVIAKEEAGYVKRWHEAGMNLKPVENMNYADNYESFTFRVAERWSEKADGLDLCEPILASYWLPFSIRENRLQVCAEKMRDGVNKLAPFVEKKGQKLVYGRYAGGPICSANDDEDLFGLFGRNVSYQVVEPGRPVLRVFSQQPQVLPQPSYSPFDLEPSNEQLREWASKGKILITLIFHSGELSHDDAMINVMELSSLTKVRVGLPVQAARYIFDPDSVEPMHIPIKEGGVLGLCEPILHSGGFGIIAESLGTPDKIATMMSEARYEIVKSSGDRFAPRGVYCYLDASPQKWNKRSERLWKAIGNAGFEYVLSSVNPEVSRILFQDENVIVLNLQCDNFYPSSPFIRVNSVAQMIEMERQSSRTGRPTWMINVIDTPIFAYSAYLLQGKSRLSSSNLYKNSTLGSFFEYVTSGGETHKLVSATPHTIARYANILKEEKLIEKR